MDELLKELRVEHELVSQTLAGLEEALSRGSLSVVERAAIATFVMNAYNGIENMLKRVFKHRALPLPDSETWHKDLLQISHEAGIITEELLGKLDEYRAFRHFFVHGYGILLDERKLLPLAEGLQPVWEVFLGELSAYLGVANLLGEEGNTT
ncbi:MAG: hypothetical protein RMM06_10210 [Armatimonadota bacterium]|nr:hypothetical protein [Armatimonadota bacterium]